MCICICMKFESAAQRLLQNPAKDLRWNALPKGQGFEYATVAVTAFIEL